MFSLPSQPKVLVEPFAGGGIISLTAAFESLSDKVVMVELDKQIAAVWETILGGDAKWLAKRLITFELTPESAKAELGKPPHSHRELAFQTMLKNRTAHGGILAEGAGVLKNGENGKGILSRWYPQTIAKRITNIELVAGRLNLSTAMRSMCLLVFRKTGTLCSSLIRHTRQAASALVRDSTHIQKLTMSICFSFAKSCAAIS